MHLELLMVHMAMCTRVFGQPMGPGGHARSGGMSCRPAGVALVADPGSVLGSAVQHPLGGTLLWAAFVLPGPERQQCPCRGSRAASSRGVA